VALGKLLPDVVSALSKLEFGTGSQVNIPIAVLIWLIFAGLRGWYERGGRARDFRNYSILATAR